MPGLDQLHRKTRQVAERNLASDETVVTVVEGRSKQAMVVTDRQILVVKPGLMAGAALGAKATSFPLEIVTTVNLHTGPGVAALELVVAGGESPPKADLRAAYQLSNWLPCHRSLGKSPLVGQLRAYVQSGGQAESARAALGGT